MINDHFEFSKQLNENSQNRLLKQLNLFPIAAIKGNKHVESGEWNK